MSDLACSYNLAEPTPRSSSIQANNSQDLNKIYFYADVWKHTNISLEIIANSKNDIFDTNIKNISFSVI